MPELLFNPFQAIDIFVPDAFHSSFERYCQRSADANPDNSPFPRMVDLWFLCVCVAARNKLKVSGKEKIKTKKIIDGSVFGSDPWRIHALMLISIGYTGDVNIVAEPRKMITLASQLAVAGMPMVFSMLQDGEAEAIWNLSEAVGELIRN